MSFHPAAAGRKGIELEKNKHMKTLLLFALGLIAAVAAWSENPPKSGNPYSPRGRATSPNGNYEVVVKTSPELKYDLVEKPTEKVVASVPAYYQEANEFNEKYAKAVGVYWNTENNIVAIDELNRRAAGYLYFLVLQDGSATEIKADSLIPIPRSADLGRTVIDRGWITPTRIAVRLSLTERGQHTDTLYTIDFADPRHPTVKKTGTK
jgi:hypothetical protein